ncbi:uncharacterized protein LOC130497544 [Raphanus sativus]|uniref:Uncharacterized protein LOC130497544 n=1 Tax=Raphanus sativus TaxID=3726 RepID=A0A9W3C4G2_RAPSA|nr:uncharacterized protein LOC130497544 [Raphanus sativus]
MYKSITLQVFPDKPEKRSASRYSSFDSVAMELAYAYSLQVVGSLKSYRSSICLSVATLGELSVVEKFLVLGLKEEKGSHLSFCAGLQGINLVGDTMCNLICHLVGVTK